MSAFMVSATHIDAMLSAGLRMGRTRLTWFWPPLDPTTDRRAWSSADLHRQANERRRWLTRETAGRVGAMLLAENRRSVDHRYDEQEWEEPYLFTELPGRPDPLIVLKAVDCYHYQSCEHPGWAASEAAAFCEALRTRAIFCLPGYDEAPWEIVDRHVFVNTRR